MAQKYTTHYPGRRWARDMNLWAEQVRENIKKLEERVATLEGKPVEASAYKPADPWPWPQEPQE
jgi:hypothetical protein